MFRRREAQRSPVPSVAKERGQPTIVLAANTSWNLVNFRSNIIVALLQKGFRIVAFAPRDDYSMELEALGVRFVAVEFRSSAISPARDAILWLRYFTLLRQLGPAVFLGFTIKPNIYGSLAARSLGIPVINNVSGLGTAFMRKGLIKSIATQLYRQAFRRSATIFFQNVKDRDDFLKARIVDAKRTRLLPGSGVDLERFRPAPLPSGQPFTFLLIARLLWDKGVQEYVDAARIVKHRHPEARFQILGFTDVDNRTSVPRSVLEGWINENLVEHLGVTKDVRSFIALADCIVLPSYREGLARSLLEASAMGRPIVATDVPGVRDVVDHGLTGLLCEPRSGPALASAMLAMMDTPVSGRRAMGLAGRHKVEREFAIAEVTRRYLDAIDLALRSPNPQSPQALADEQ